ncbi:MAG: FAD/NAD(P)-binding protein, partial [Halioglobus sp.]
MHIIILGGGAAGMISAHYLAKKHRVTVIERESILGGNIRTLNGNVATENLPPGLFVDNGVIEFHRDSSPALHSVIQELGLQLAPVSGGSTALYLDNQRSLHMPGAIREQTASRAAKLKRYLQLGLTLRHMIPIGMRTLAYGR